MTYLALQFNRKVVYIPRWAVKGIYRAHQAAQRPEKLVGVVIGRKLS